MYGALLVSAATFTVVIVASYQIQNAANKTSEEVLRYKKADAILDKTLNLETLSSLQALKNSRGDNDNAIASIPELRNKPFSTLVLDTKGVNSEAINKYAEAALAIMNDNPNASDDAFDCSALVNTGKITLKDCMDVADQNFTFAEKESGNLKYTLSEDMSKRMAIIQSNRATNLTIKTASTDGNTSIENTKTIVLPPNAFAKQQNKVTELEAEVETLVRDGKLELASYRLGDIDKINTPSVRAAQLRVEIVLRQLVQGGAAVYPEAISQPSSNDTNTSLSRLKIEDQDISKVNQNIKNSIVKSLANSSEVGAQKYGNFEQSKLLMESILNEISYSPDKYQNLSSDDIQRFKNAIQIMKSN